MNSLPLLPWRWIERTPALTPDAVIAFGAVTKLLHARLLLIPEEQWSQWSLTATGEVLVVCGPSQQLPWVDGVQYAAAIEHAPGLWLPTCWQPEAPAELVAQALQQRYQRRPFLLWPQPSLVLPLDRLQPLSAKLLQHVMQSFA